jgi:hypothetical protein
MRYSDLQLDRGRFHKCVEKQLGSGPVPIRERRPIEFIVRAKQLVGKDINAISVDWLPAHECLIHNALQALLSSGAWRRFSALAAFWV